MKLPCLNKSLVWKEWRQNRRIFWFVFLLMSFVPLCQPLLSAIDRALRPSAYYAADGAAAWSRRIAHMLHNDAGMLGAAGMVLAFLLLGIAMLAQERTHGTLRFLIATPVSRRDIVNAKYAVGISALLLMLLVNFLFIVGVWMLFPVQYGVLDAIRWLVLTAATLITGFSLSFMVSTITGNALAAGIGVLGLLLTPMLLLKLVAKVLRLSETLDFISWGREGSQVLLTLGDYLTLPSYLGYPQGAIQEGCAACAWAIPAMLLAAFLFYHGSIWLFQKNQLEKNGQLLMLGDLARMVTIGAPLLAAILIAVIMVDEFRPDALTVITTFLGVDALGFAVLAIVFRINALGCR